MRAIVLKKMCDRDTSCITALQHVPWIFFWETTRVNATYIAKRTRDARHHTLAWSCKVLYKLRGCSPVTLIFSKYGCLECVRMEGRYVLPVFFLFYRTQPSEITETNLTELCDTFGSEPDLKMDFRNLSSLSSKRGSQKLIAYFRVVLRPHRNLSADIFWMKRAIDKE